jgi:hypothetical protein
MRDRSVWRHKLNHDYFYWFNCYSIYYWQLFRASNVWINTINCAFSCYFVTVFWTFMWGALGAFLGVPIAITALTMCEQFPSTRWISAILAAEPT